MRPSLAQADMGGGCWNDFSWKKLGNLGETKPFALRSRSLDSLYSLGMVPMASARGCIPPPFALPHSAMDSADRMGKLKKELKSGGGWRQGAHGPLPLGYTLRFRKPRSLPDALTCLRALYQGQLFYFGFPHTQGREKYRK